MTGLACKRLFFVIAVTVQPWMAPQQARAMAEDDVFQQAINYIFTGRIDPSQNQRPEITDRDGCVVVVPEPNFSGYARYYLKRFKMDVSRISKRYAGRRVFYQLEVDGDNIIFESLETDKKTVEFGLRSAHISLPGNIDQTKRALKRVFSEHCKPDKPKSLF